MIRSWSLTINAVLYMLLGLLLIYFSTSLGTFQGVSHPGQSFFMRTLGIVLIGVAIALLFERFPRPAVLKTEGLGLVGAICVNLVLTLAIIVGGWQRIGNIELWTLVAVIVVISVAEFVALIRGEGVTQVSPQGGISLSPEKLVPTVLFILLLIGVIIDELKLFHAVILGFFASLTFVFARRLLDEVQQGDTPSFESHWGGFGGGLGGWRLSPSLVFLLVVLALGTLTIISASSVITRGDTAPTQLDMPTEAPAPADKSAPVTADPVDSHSQTPVGGTP